MCARKFCLKGPFMVLFLVWLGISLATESAAAGERFQLTSRGQGEDLLVMIPGLASSDQLWQPWVERYQSDYRVTTVNITGFADGRDAGDWPGLAAMADDLADKLSRRAGDGDLLLVGHSLGGQLALQVAARLPDQVAQVMVIDSLPFFARLYNPAVAPEGARQQAAAMAQQFRAMNDDAWHSQQSQNMKRLSLTPDMRKTLVQWSQSSDRELVIAAMEELMGTDYGEVLPKVTADVLVLMAHDKTMGVAKQQLAGLYKSQYQPLENFELRVVSDAYHFLMVDQTEVFTRILDNWLKAGA